MTVKQFSDLLKKNNIPENAELVGDSGCEYYGTIVKTVFYDPDNNIVILTQDGEEEYLLNDGYIIDDVSKPTYYGNIVNVKGE